MGFPGSPEPAGGNPAPLFNCVSCNVEVRYALERAGDELLASRNCFKCYSTKRRIIKARRHRCPYCQSNSWLRESQRHEIARVPIAEEARRGRSLRVASIVFHVTCDECGNAFYDDQEELLSSLNYTVRCHRHECGSRRLKIIRFATFDSLKVTGVAGSAHEAECLQCHVRYRIPTPRFETIFMLRYMHRFPVLRELKENIAVFKGKEREQIEELLRGDASWRELCLELLKPEPVGEAVLDKIQDTFIGYIRENVQFPKDMREWRQKLSNDLSQWKAEVDSTSTNMKVHVARFMTSLIGELESPARIEEYKNRVEMQTNGLGWVFWRVLNPPETLMRYSITFAK